MCASVIAFKNRFHWPKITSISFILTGKYLKESNLIVYSSWWNW